MSEFTSVSFDKVRVTGGFWKKKQDVNADVTARAVCDRFTETHRFDALSCNSPDETGFEPHIFWDSDVAKWIEGAAYILSVKRDAFLENVCEKAISDIISSQSEDGYFNSYFQVMEPEARFTRRGDHELYCAGHLIEAAIAYDDATGKDAFLRAMIRYADLIYRVFYVEQSAAFETSGHPEIELALFRLSDKTGDEKYARLAKFFLDMRGNNKKDPKNGMWGASYEQSHLPLKEQTTAEGHCVRAGYIFSAMADCAAHFSDEEYKSACKKLFANITERRMYITGGIGSNPNGERFGGDFELPNKTAYAETCAAISLAYFSRRMLHLEPDSRYADAVERVMYNGFLCGVSQGGKRFFYSNPMEVDSPSVERAELFFCSCCPPNVVRFSASITEDFYTYRDDVLFVHQYAQSEANIGGAVITQTTDYPADGAVDVTVSGKFKTLALRIPGWCGGFTLNVPYRLENGYAYCDIPEDGKIALSLDMKIKAVESDTRVKENAGKAALTRGPVVYCLEGRDNVGDLSGLTLCENGEFKAEPSDILGVPVIYADGARGAFPVTLKFIPYFATLNRGPDVMKVWIETK